MARCSCVLVTLASLLAVWLWHPVSGIRTHGRMALTGDNEAGTSTSTAGDRSTASAKGADQNTLSKAKKAASAKRPSIVRRLALLAMFLLVNAANGYPGMMQEEGVTGCQAGRVVHPAWVNKPSEKFTSTVAAYEQKGNEMGPKLNDHDFNTSLGQGNTLGFVKAYLRIKPQPESRRVGIFAKEELLAAVVRLSDFGPSESGLRLARLAMKVQHKDASGQNVEANLLFTESMYCFTLADFTDVASFANDTEMSKWKQWTSYFSMLWDGARCVVPNLRSILKGRYQKALDKHYYSQLPYAWEGANLAMKYELRPVIGHGATEPPADARQYATKSAEETQDILSRSGVEYELWGYSMPLQGNQKMIERDAAATWKAEAFHMATLEIPQQACGDRCVSDDISRLAGATSQKARDAFDKSFNFHPDFEGGERGFGAPYGDVQKYRGEMYPTHSANRLNTLQKGMLEDNKPLSFPFNSLLSQGLWGNIEERERETEANTWTQALTKRLGL